MRKKISLWVIGTVHYEKSITLQFIIKSNSLAHHYVTEATLQGSVQLAALIIHMSRISVSL